MLPVLSNITAIMSSDAIDISDDDIADEKVLSQEDNNRIDEICINSNKNWHLSRDIYASLLSRNIIPETLNDAEFRRNDRLMKVFYKKVASNASPDVEKSNYGRPFLSDFNLANNCTNSHKSIELCIKNLGVPGIEFTDRDIINLFEKKARQYNYYRKVRNTIISNFGMPKAPPKVDKKRTKADMEAEIQESLNAEKDALAAVAAELKTKSGYLKNDFVVDDDVKKYEARRCSSDSLPSKRGTSADMAARLTPGLYEKDNISDVMNVDTELTNEITTTTTSSLSGLDNAMSELGRFGEKKR